MLLFHFKKQFLRVLAISLFVLVFLVSCKQVSTAPEEQIDVPTITSISTIEPTNTATPYQVKMATQAPERWRIVDVVNDLKEKIQNNYPVNGWLWQQVEYIHFGKRSYVPRLPNGNPFPSDYFEESWYHLNERKLVDQSITLTKSTDDQILATVIYSNNRLYSPWLEQPKEMEPYSNGDFDRSFLDTVKQFAERSKHEVEQKALEGKQVICISAFQQGPLKLEEFNINVQMGITEGCYDSVNGWSALEESRYIFEDGTEQIGTRIKTEIQTGINPPEEILQRFETMSK